MPTTYDDLPTLPLTDPHHQQVRALLVREARPVPVRRWVVPLAVAAVTATVGVVALGGGQLLGTGRDAPAVVPDEVDCSLGIVPGAVDDVPDAWRLISDDPGDLVVTNAVRLSPTTCPGQPAGQPAERPLQVLAALQPDGTVTAALTVWADAPARTGEGTDAVTVRGVPGTVQVGTEQYGTERVWWSEAGEERSVSASGLDRQTVLALVEQLDRGGALPPSAYPEGMTSLTWEDPGPLEPYEPEWGASYVVPGTDADPQVEAQSIGVSVSRTRQPWQSELSQWYLGGIPPRIVEVDGRQGVLFSNGGPDLWLTYSLGDGVQAHVAGVGDEVTGGALAFAETLEPVAADDPRIVEIDWSSGEDAVQTTSP